MPQYLRIVCFLLVLISFIDPAAAQPRDRLETSIAGYRALVLMTGDAKPSDSVPMIVGLHYSSARPETIAADFDGIDFPARIVLPQGKYPRRDGYSWFPSDYGSLGAAQQNAVTFAIKDELAAFVESATQTFPTQGKPILAGVSYGGDLAFLLAVYHPEKFQASFPVAARFLPTWIPESSRCTRNCPLVYAMHGDQDHTVPMSPSRDASKSLRELGVRIEFHVYEGAAHEFSMEMRQDFAARAATALALSQHCPHE